MPAKKAELLTPEDTERQQMQNRLFKQLFPADEEILGLGIQKGEELEHWYDRTRDVFVKLMITEALFSSNAKVRYDAKRELLHLTMPARQQVLEITAKRSVVDGMDTDEQVMGYVIETLAKDPKALKQLEDMVGKKAEEGGDK